LPSIRQFLLGPFLAPVLASRSRNKTGEPYGDPLSGRYEQGGIYGRGALEMKAGLCAAIAAVKVLWEIGFQNDGDIYISSFFELCFSGLPD
jgi:hypothetical protein